VANADKRNRGRVTPKKSATPPPRVRARRQPPKQIGPFKRPDASAPLGQVGRRPTPPGRLFVFAGMYFVCGVLSFFVLGGSLKFIIGVVMIGLSGLWLRGAMTAYVRQHGSDE
jgi:hypothetical protein